MDVAVDKSHVSFNLYCPVHPNILITFFSTNDNAQRSLCNICTDSYSKKEELIPVIEVKEKNILTALAKASQQEGSDNPEDMIKSIENEFDKFKSIMIDMVENAKKQVLNNLQKSLPRKKGWNTMLVELQKKYEETFNAQVDPNSIGFQQFIASYNVANQALERKDQEVKVKVGIMHNEFDKLSKGIVEKFNSQKDKLVKLDQQIVKTNARFNFSKIKKDKTIKTDYKKGMSPTCLTYLEGFDFFATSGDKDITLWSTKTGERKKRLAGAHSEPIVSLAFSPKQRILMSCAPDRTLKLYKVNQNGILSLFKTFGLGVGNNVSGLLVIDDKDIFIGCGESNKIKIWSLNNLAPVACIKTGDHKDYGPHLAYCRKEDLLAVYAFKSGKILVFCMKKKIQVATLDTSLKANSIFSLDLVWIEKNSWLMTSCENKMIRIYNFKDRKIDNNPKEILVEGYSMGFLPFEEEDCLLMSNYMKDIHVIQITSKKIIHNVNTGLKNAANLIHMKDVRKFAVSDMLTEKINLFSY